MLLIYFTKDKIDKIISPKTKSKSKSNRILSLKILIMILVKTFIITEMIY